MNIVNKSKCFSLCHRPGCCYETATTRQFYHGRTETMRPCTQEAVHWCKAMIDPTCEVTVCLCVKFKSAEAVYAHFCGT